MEHGEALFKECFGQTYIGLKHIPHQRDVLVIPLAGKLHGKVADEGAGKLECVCHLTEEYRSVHPYAAAGCL